MRSCTFGSICLYDAVRGADRTMPWVTLSDMASANSCPPRKASNSWTTDPTSRALRAAGMGRWRARAISSRRYIARDVDIAADLSNRSGFIRL
jgi:hypothetical protein